MKSLVIFAVVLAVAVAEPGLSRGRPNPPYINRPKPPTGTGPHARVARSPEPEPQGSVVFQTNKPLSGPDRRPTHSLDYQHKIFENKHGHISASGGAVKYPGQKVQPQVGIQGSFRFRRSPEPEPQGSVVFQTNKPLSGPDRRPTSSIDYQHKIFENKHGHISASGGAVKFPGQKVQPQVGIQGSFRFRRSPEPEPQGSIYAHGTQHTTGPNRKPTWEAGYQHKVWENKHGSISVNAGASKTPNTHTQGQAGIKGEFRFRRSPEPEPQGSISFQGTKPLSGPDRRPTSSIDYNHKIFENKQGSITASGGAVKLPGQRVQPHVGIQGSFRFRRSPEPEPQGSISFQGTKPLSGPDRRPTSSIDYNHKIFENKQGSITASGGAVKLPGQRVQPHVGIQGSFRFRRSADESELEEYVAEE